MMNCSRCGLIFKKREDRKKLEIRYRGLKDATFCDDCLGWWFETLKVERGMKIK